MKQEQFDLIIDSNYREKENLITEIKGNMRFWFRLINSNQNNHKYMYYIEGILFGDAKNNKSPISIRCKSIKENIYTLEINLHPFFNNKNFEDLHKLLSSFENVIDALEKAKNIIINKNIEWYINLLKLSLTLGDLGVKSRKLHKTKGNKILRLVTIVETDNDRLNIADSLKDINLLNKNKEINIESISNFDKIREKIRIDFKLGKEEYLVDEKRNLQLGKIYKLENITKANVLFSNTCYNWLTKQSSKPRNKFSSTLINISSIKNINSFDIYISVFMSINKNK